MPSAEYRRFCIALAVLCVVAAALLDVTITNPRVHVRWRDAVTAGERISLERRYSLRSGQRVEDTTWSYELLDQFRDNVGALVADPAVDDTAGFDRSTLEAPRRQVHLDAGRARFLIGEAPLQLVQLQSLLLCIVGVFVLWASRSADQRSRRAAKFQSCSATPKRFRCVPGWSMRLASG